jgi:hypothetical protein
MVDMRMGQAERIDSGRTEGEMLVVELPFGFRSLKHAAIDQDAGSIRLKHEAGAGHGASSAKKVDAKRQGELLSMKNDQAGRPHLGTSSPHG